MQPHDEFAGCIRPVALALLGEPNRAQSSATELRFGSRGSMSVDLQRGVWHDHEAGNGGGVLDLVARETGRANGEAVDWLREQGFLADMAAEPERPGQRRIVATYDYRDEGAALLFQVCRFEPKDFRQRRPDGNGGWSWSVKSVRQVPYRLFELRATVAHNRVFIVEGEKDVDRLAAVGLVATCNAGGAGKWPDALSGHFAGCDVALLPDNDEPGRAHAERVAAALSGVAASIRVVELPGLPPKGDVSDWIDAGGTAADLARLANAAPLWGDDAGPCAWGNVPSRKRVDFLFAPYVPAGQITILAGPPGCGKGTIAADLAARVTRGEPLPHSSGVPFAPRNVLWCESEDSQEHTLSPRLEAAGADLPRVKLAKIGDPALADLRQTIINNNVGLVVLSPFVSFIPGLEDANSELATREALQRTLAAVEGLPVALLPIMHPNKQTGLPALNRILGSTAFVAFVRSVLIVGGTDDERRFVHAKHNLSKRGPDLIYSIVDEGPAPADGMIRVQWQLAPDQCHPDSLWSPRANKKPKAADWLVTFLMANGETPMGDVLKAGLEAGFTGPALTKAAARSKKIRARRDGFQGPSLWSYADGE